jgi:hypothetical protein
MRPISNAASHCRAHITVRTPHIGRICVPDNFYRDILDTATDATPLRSTMRSHKFLEK